MDAFPPDRLVISLEEVAKLTGFSEHSIRRGCADHIYRHTYFGKKYGMTREHVTLLIAAVERGGDAAPTPAPEDDEVEAARQATAAQYARRGAA